MENNRGYGRGFCRYILGVGWLEECGMWERRGRRGEMGGLSISNVSILCVMNEQLLCGRLVAGKYMH